jgi:RHS repeat-associated protein
MAGLGADRLVWLELSAAGGLVPQVSLSYDSGSADGETGVTNNQPSAVGDGWSLAGAGFIERSYVPCSVDGVSTSSDLCWKSDNASISFAGHSGHLIKDRAGNWHIEGDDGSKIEKLTGAVNGDAGTAGTDGSGGAGEYWKLTTTDGTQYFFGLNHLPGWVSGNAETQSTWTVPVFGNNSGEPCYNASFASASCLQAWRWNLDYVVTPHTTSEAYYYTPETNMYLRDNASLASYTRGGQLARVEYGTTGGSGLTTTAPARLLFDTADRCSNTAAACDATHASNAPDVPWDQACTTVATCAGHTSPTFFTQKMISKIHAQTASGSTYSDVDLWTLTHSFPPPGDTTSPALWLASISHSGTTTSAAVPNVVFAGTPMQNRVLVVDGSALQWKYRISSLTTETGAKTTISYSGQACNSSSLPAPEANNQPCFPQWWAPTGQNPQLDWFNKYAVTQVSTDAWTGGSQQPTDDYYYDYPGTPGWRYDNSPFIEAAKRTWSQFAGYSQVRVRHGSDSSPSTQETSTYTYYRGLNGDRLNAAGGSKAATVSASDGSSVPDSLWLAGQVRETLISNGNSGPRSAPIVGNRVSNTIITPWALQTATDGTYSSYLTGTADTVTRTALAAGGNRTTEISYVHDGHGRTISVNDLGDTATPDDDRCTTTSYADNPTAWLLSYPSEVAVVGIACGAAVTYPADAISDTRTFYDGSTTLGVAPTVGNPTQVDVVTGYTGTTAASAQWQPTTSTTYDSVGRPLKVTDLRYTPNRSNNTAYLPTGAGLPTQVTTSNTLTWGTITVLDPRWGVPTKVTDQNSHVTEATYDGLGRRLQVWLPERLRASNTVPTVSYAYTISASAPTTVATTSLLPSGGTITTYALYDGLLRPRQTQAPAEGGGIDLTDTLYDSAGRVSITNATYYTPGTPGGTLLNPSTSVPGQTVTGYDGDGRTSYTAQLINNAEVWRTSYTYGGDHVDMTPPTGGIATTTTTDARGNTTALTQYHAATPTGPADTTNYTYYPAGQMKSMTDPAHNSWTWNYDVLGRLTSAHDPDRGDTSNTYDAGGNLASTQDADGNVLAYTYDTLNRKTGEYAGSTSGTELASWSYDTLASGTDKGQLVSSTRYIAGAAFATSTVNSFDAADRVTSQKMVINSGVMAGTYITTSAYNPDGQLASIGHNAYAGLNGDGVSYPYDNLGNPAGAIGTNAVNYVGAATYSAIGQVTKYQAAIGSESYVRSFSYQDGISRLLSDGTTTNIPGNGNADLHTYTYDDAGLVTEDQNAVAAVGTDTQCFTYDYLQELKDAWTPSNGTCDPHTISDGALGGPAPYWSTYSYDTLGNRATATQHATYLYTGGGPHAVSSVTPDGTSVTPATSYSYDSTGNTTAAPGGKTFSWDTEGRLAGASVGGQAQSEIYDANGNLLQQTDPTGTTLYLGDTEVHANPGSTVLSLTRTYSFLGHAVAERSTKPGVTGSTVDWLITDSHNTAEVSIDTTTDVLTRRHTDPFGNARDTGLVSWTDNHGFLNAPLDNLTGTVRLGAREYDPTIGRFLSVDSVLQPGNPQQNNGYSYAWNNPISHADPSGLRPADDAGGITGSDLHDWQHTENQAQAAAPAPAGNAGPAIDPNKILKSINVVVPSPSYNPNTCARTGIIGCSHSTTMSLYDLLHQTGPKNYCGDLSWACTLVGYNQARNCAAGGGAGVCVGAVIAIAGDIFLVAKGFKLISILDELGAAASDGISVGAGGDWPRFNEVPGGVTAQITGHSCGSACAETLSGVAQADVLESAGEHAGVGAIADALGDGWRGGYVGPENLDQLAARGPFGAELYEGGSQAHMVVVDGIDKAGDVTIRDPWSGGSTYQMTQHDFQQYWNGNALFH